MLKEEGDQGQVAAAQGEGQSVAAALLPALVDVRAAAEHEIQEHQVPGKPRRRVKGTEGQGPRH